MRLKDWMDIVQYKITEAYEFQWNCYGPNAHGIESWNYDQKGYSVDVIFDRKNQTVYECRTHDYDANTAFRWTHPDHIQARVEEAEKRDIDDVEAFEGVGYTDLDENAWVAKTYDIVEKFNS